MDGMTMHRQQPFAHWISWLLASIHQNEHMLELESSRSRFKTYRPTAPDDRRRGPCDQHRAQ